MTLHVSALVCELGVTIITFLELMSGYKDPDQQDSSDLIRQNARVAAISVSLATTLLVFGLTVIGAGSSFAGARKAAAAAQGVATRVSATTETPSRWQAVGERMSAATKAVSQQNSSNGGESRCRTSVQGQHPQG